MDGECLRVIIRGCSKERSVNERTQCHDIMTERVLDGDVGACCPSKLMVMYE